MVRMTDAPVFTLRAGPGAAAHVRDHGLAPQDIACLPAAAGGPKGLALVPLDKLLCRHWLPHMPALELIGASVGAWRAASLAQPEPIAALERMQHAYVHDQNYAGKPTPHDVAIACRRIARAVLGNRPLQIRPGVSLSIVTARARGPLHGTESKFAFARAVFSNTLARNRLAAHLQRVVFQAGAPSFLALAHDDFDLVRVALSPANEEPALVASGSIPIICTPVRDIPGAPAGYYWDGALVDYHLVLPYPELTRSGDRRRIVLYPHFNDYLTPGWLDKHLPWRKAPRNHPWLSDTLLIAPSPAFLATLPNGRLPDRSDFHRYGPDHAARIAAWERAIGECGRFAEAVMRWLERPDPTQLQPI
jgi:predicted acylesterase/phospholipase RssA